MQEFGLRCRVAKTQGKQTRCGTIALIGAPNAGKSTLLNRLVGSKIAIVTPKAQTTRSRVTGVCLAGDTQMIFLDVPGVFDAKQSFERAMVSAAWSGANEADAIAFLYDSYKEPTAETEQALRRISNLGKPLFLALNKIDALKDKGLLLKRVEWFSAQVKWNDIFMTSSLTGEGVDALKTALAKELPEGAWRYPEDAMTDVPMRVIASELTREQCFLRLQQELPYTLTVETEQYTTRDDGSAEIHQIIIVQNERQKGIVIGKGGQMLKAIGEKARAEIGKVIGAKCHLKLFVKVKEDWKERPEAYQYMGLEFKG